MPDVTLGQLADSIGAVLENGDASRVVRRPAGLAEAGPGDVSFLANPAYRRLLAACGAEAVVVGRDVEAAAVPFLRTDNPDIAFAKAALILSPPPPLPPPGVHPTAVVAPGASVGKDVSIGAWTIVEEGAVVGDRCVLFPQTYVGTESRLGDECVLYPGVKIYHRVTIGSRCVFHAGVVIGSDGFGYAWTGGGYLKIPQVGTVVVGDDVEIGANACVDRARFGETRIGSGTKLDNLVQIAHNVKIGPMCAFAALVGIAGSAEVGAGVQMGGQASVVGHIVVGDGLTILGQSAVTKSVPGRESGVTDKEHLTWAGSPAKPMRELLKEFQNVKSVGRLKKTVRELEERLAKLEAEKNGG